MSDSDDPLRKFLIMHRYCLLKRVKPIATHMSIHPDKQLGKLLFKTPELIFFKRQPKKVRALHCVSVSPHIIKTAIPYCCGIAKALPDHYLSKQIHMNYVKIIEFKTCPNTVHLPTNLS